MSTPKPGEWGGGCPVKQWDGPYQYVCGLGGNGGVCAYHGQFAERPQPDPGEAKQERAA